jgi:hypothetical protein
MASRASPRRKPSQRTAEVPTAKKVKPAAGTASAPGKKKRAAVPKPRKPRKKKEPVRMRARWGVFDGSMKQVAIFDYSQRQAADEKLAELMAKKKGLYFLQIVKEPMSVSEADGEPAEKND